MLVIREPSLLLLLNPKVLKKKTDFMPKKLKSITDKADHESPHCFKNRVRFSE